MRSPLSLRPLRRAAGIVFALSPMVGSGSRCLADSACAMLDVCLRCSLGSLPTATSVAMEESEMAPPSEQMAMAAEPGDGEACAVA